jgi:hypothetical protein
MFRNILGGICRNRCGLVAIAGVIGVLTGIESLMCSRTHVKAGPVANASPLGRDRSKRQDYFRIRRTKFEIGIRRGGVELGYTYWVLQGFGKHRCFVLCDTWQEAIEEATARLSGGRMSARPERNPRERRVTARSIADMQRA